MDFIKRSNRLYDSCLQCGLPKPYCICKKVESVNLDVEIIIITAEREFSRPSSTGRLFKLINREQTQIIKWDRKNPNEELIHKINSNLGNIFLVYPVEEVECVRENRIKIVEKPIFIFIDGTWQEAKKIYRKSDYLKDLPIINIEHEVESIFDLRKVNKEDNLSTIEAIIEVLRIRNDKSLNLIEKNYKLFIDEFKRALNNC